VFRQLHLMAASDLRLFGLLLFFLFFVAVLVRCFVFRRERDFAAVAHLPLQDDDRPLEPRS
jgi:cbb3-type cytochrome oxidase subunit 3